MKKKLYGVINKISLKTQLVVLISFTFTFIIVCIIAYNYRSNQNAIKEQQVIMSAALLDLEAQNLDAYFSEISRYSLLLRHDEAFVRSINSDTPLNYAEKTNLQNLLRSNFDSRNDLSSYRLYLLRKTENYYIDSKRHKVKPFYDANVAQLPGYELFTKGKYYSCLLPSSKEGTFLTFYRTIIRIEDQAPLAVVELIFDTSFIDSIAADHEPMRESFCILDKAHRILYSNNADINDDSAADLIASMSNTSENHFTVSIADKPYLTVYHTSMEHGYTMFSFKPLSVLARQLYSTRNISLLLAFISITAATIFVYIFTRLVTNPLSSLSQRLRCVGSGNFTTADNIEGSLEILNLSSDFNFMVRHIEDLIQKNYVAELNTKTAQLIALEAQVNPHFLYNTLQAISSEAIINHQPKINAMITSLASMLRYSIKEEEFVMLSQEVKHVKDYLSLQHSRFDERLTYTLNIEDATLTVMIPKLCIQMLTENSIIHGMDGSIDRLHITVHSYISGKQLIIKVEDNRIGIEPSRIAELKEHFAKPELFLKSSSGIGLLNLSSRLHILYEEPASITIESVQNKYTSVTISIPTGIPKGGKHHV